jgi:hypothetical protein
LDYWYLSTVDLDRLLGVGSCLKNLTTSYRVEDDYEYRRFNPDFNSQTPDFFREVAEFYLTGVFKGFEIGDIRLSHRLFKWLRHELLYADAQRTYAREWLYFWSGIATGSRNLAAPVKIHSSWQEELIRDLGRALFRMVKRESYQYYSPAPVMAFNASAQKTDYRFFNLRKSNWSGRAIHTDAYRRYQTLSFYKCTPRALSLFRGRSLSELSSRLFAEHIRKLEPVSLNDDNGPDMLFLIP